MKGVFLIVYGIAEIISIYYEYFMYCTSKENNATYFFMHLEQRTKVGFIHFGCNYYYLNVYYNQSFLFLELVHYPYQRQNYGCAECV